MWGGGAVKQGIHAILQVQPDLQAAAQVQLPVHCLYQPHSCLVNCDIAIGILSAKIGRYIGSYSGLYACDPGER